MLFRSLCLEALAAIRPIRSARPRSTGSWNGSSRALAFGIPNACAAFGQLGFRVPFLVVSPFAKAHYVSHTVGDHASILAFIEERFLNDQASGGAGRLHLTLRDQYASPLEDLFDFDNAPSLDTLVIEAQPPVIDCTPAGY